MKRKILLSIVAILILIGMITTTGQAQQEEYRLNLHRTFGYSSGSQIRGTFSMDVITPQNVNIKSVTYLIDGQVMSTIGQAPYSLSFQTTQYANGWHDLSAIIETVDGKKITTTARHLEFATAEQESSTVVSLIVPILGGVLVVMAVGMGLQMLTLKNKPASNIPLGAPRQYGFKGGAACPHCHRTFSIHWWALNLGFLTKFDRCDFCGKWSIVKHLNKTELAIAEAAELQQAQPSATVTTKTEDERLKEMIEKSKYVQ
jgi:hypothetical protein